MTALEELKLALGTGTTKPAGFYSAREWARVFRVGPLAATRRLKALVDEKSAELAYWRPPGRSREAVYRIMGLGLTPESPAGGPTDRPSAPACTRPAPRSSKGTTVIRNLPLRLPARPS